MDYSRKRNKVLYSEGNWANMPLDLLLLVVRQIDSVKDYFAFRKVCAGWRLAGSYETDFNRPRRESPLLFETKNDKLEFSTPLATQQPHAISTITNMEKLVARLSKEMKIQNCLGCRGWLFVVQNNGDMNLVHAMSGTCIDLPRHEKSYNSKNGINKISLSSSPFTDPSNFTLVIVYSSGDMAYWRLGDKTFTELPCHSSVSDVIYCSSRGVFYGLSYTQQILSIEAINHEYPTTLARIKIRKLPESCCPYSPSIYWTLGKFLVESNGDLLLVVQHDGNVKDSFYSDILGWKRIFEFYFRVYKIEEFGKEYYCTLTEVKNLGNRALFVGGLGASISVNASDVPGCKPNHIYYTGHENHEGKMAHAVYNLADGSVDGCGVFSEKYFMKYPSLWVTPSFV